MDNELTRDMLPGSAVTAAGVLILLYKDPVQALGIVTCLGGVFWVGYAVLNNVLDRLGMSIDDFFF